MREEICSGRATHERKLAVCAGSVSLDPGERVELLAVLAFDADEALAERAAGAALTQPVEAFQAALARPDAAPQLYRYCAAHMLEKPGIADALALNPNCPAEPLLASARHFSTIGVQALMENLDRLSTAPALVAMLSTSSSLTADQLHQLQELQQGTGDPAAIEEAVAAAEPEGAKRITLLQKLARMRVIERVQLALKGGREERLALIRDPCKVVQRAVLQSARLSEREVESFAAMANLSEEVLRMIAMNRNFRKNYTITLHLVNNPKTSIDVSLRLLPNITGKDLKMLTMNKNIPETLRTAATRLHRQRGETRPSG